MNDLRGISSIYNALTIYQAKIRGEEVNVGVNELLNIITNNPGLNAKKLHTYFDITDRTLERWLKQLRDEGKVTFKAAAKTGGYYLKE